MSRGIDNPRRGCGKEAVAAATPESCLRHGTRAVVGGGRDLGGGDRGVALGGGRVGRCWWGSWWWCVAERWSSFRLGAGPRGGRGGRRQLFFSAGGSFEGKWGAPSEGVGGGESSVVVATTDTCVLSSAAGGCAPWALSHRPFYDGPRVTPIRARRQ